jgi:hypothetical protein
MDVKYTWIPTWHRKWIMFHGHFAYFQTPPHGSNPNTKPGDHGTPNPYNRWFILFYYVRGLAWMKINWNSIYSHLTSHYTRGSVTTRHDFGGVLGRPAFGHFLLGSQTFMVTARGSIHQPRRRDLPRLFFHSWRLHPPFKTPNPNLKP